MPGEEAPALLGEEKCLMLDVGDVKLLGFYLLRV
jgi:hypothetical protein